MDGLEKVGWMSHFLPFQVTCGRGRSPPVIIICESLSCNKYTLTMFFNHVFFKIKIISKSTNLETFNFKPPQKIKALLILYIVVVRQASPVPRDAR